MAKKSFRIKGNLADALDDTVQSAQNNAGELHIEIIPLRKIELDPDNPRDLALSFDNARSGFTTHDELFERKSIEKESLLSLAKSIKEQGIINPIVVYKHNEHYRLIAGERRTLASLLINKDDIPAKVLTSCPDQLKLSLIQWIENMEREDLSLWERMRNLEKIVHSYADNKQETASKITATDISKLIGCSLQQGVNYRHLINSSELLKAYIKAGDIKNIEKAALISKSEKVQQSTLIQACLAGSTLSELKKMARDTHFTSQDLRIEKKVSPKVNFGSSHSVKTAKVIIDVVLQHSDFHHFQEKLGAVQWDNHRSVTNAFKRLLKLLEHSHDKETSNVE